MVGNICHNAGTTATVGNTVVTDCRSKEIPCPHTSIPTHIRLKFRKTDMTEKRSLLQTSYNPGFGRSFRL